MLNMLKYRYKIMHGKVRSHSAKVGQISASDGFVYEEIDRRKCNAWDRMFGYDFSRWTG